MGKLSEPELWERVRHLRGRTVRSIFFHLLSGIIDVTDNKVRRVRPGTDKELAPAHREEIFNTYNYLHANGLVTGDAFQSTPGKLKHSRNSRFILAILAEAVPEEIEMFDKGNSWVLRRSEIRLRSGSGA